MVKKNSKIVKNTSAEMQYTQAPFVPMLKKASLFIGVLGISFAITVSLVRFAPILFLSLKQVSFSKILTLPSFFSKNRNEKIVFSGNENYTTIEPMLLKEYMDTAMKHIVVIDTRSKLEYENGHIKNAITIPLYEEFRRPYESLVDKAGWIGAVKKQSWGAKEVILYGYQPDADMLRVYAEALRKNGVRAKILSVGYSEWQGGLWGWIAGGELNGTLNINDYIERK